MALLTQRLQAQGYGYEVVNASVSGETTSGGLHGCRGRCEFTSPDIVILELGAQRRPARPAAGPPRSRTSRDDRSWPQAAGARVLLVGMLIPPNYGPRYTNEFAGMYPDLAQAIQLPLVPFLLEAVALDPELMQADGMHPERAGRAACWIPSGRLEPLLKKKR